MQAGPHARRGYGACSLKRYRLIKNAPRPRRRRRMRAALCRDVKISRQELQIAHDEIAFEHETLLMAFGVKMRVIVGTRQSTNQYREPLRDGILEKNRIGHS